MTSTLPLFKGDHLEHTYGIDDKHVKVGFYSSYIEMVEDLGRLINDYKMQQVAVTDVTFKCHKLKSTSNSLGAFALGHLLSEIEEAASGNSGDLGMLLARFSYLSKATIEIIALEINTLTKSTGSNDEWQ